MDNKIQEKLQELFVNYTKNLPHKLRDLQTHWQQLCEKYDVDSFKNFHREVHSLTGSAGTYGYDELSKAARELEVYLKSLLGSATISVEKQVAVTRLMQQLQETVLITDEIMYHPEVKHSIESNIIYVLDPDDGFVVDLKKEFDDAGYQLHRLKNFSELLSLLREKPELPIALVIDVEYLDASDVQKLAALQKLQDIAIPLFCTASRGDLITRLRATRAGSIAFVQKPTDAFYLTRMLGQAGGTSTSDAFKILIIDDSQSLAEYYALILQGAGMNTKTLSKPLEALDVIVEFQPDLLLLDIYMPECSGIELAAVLRQEPKFTHIPIIFLSSEEDKFKQLSALSLGGDDFLTKPILPQHLVAAVKSRAKRAGILSSVMMRDSLTGLLNHTNILHQLDLEVARAIRHESPLAFAMVDLDHFKLVNDKYGHIVGDKVLKKLSELFIMRLRKTDYVGRYGGEEFAIILPNTDISHAEKVLNELREKFYQIEFDTNGSHTTVAFSAGIASIEQFKTADEMIAAADQALYRAKQAGRNQVQIS